MAEVNVKKKKKSVKLYVILGFIVLIIILCVMANKAKAGQDPVVTVTEDGYTGEEDLNLKYGTPPVGYMWDADGNAVPVTVAGVAVDEACFRYLRALTQLDLETAGQYALDSLVISRYKDYYSSGMADYGQTQRKIYGEVLKSIEILGVRNEVLLDSDTRVLSICLKILDLSEKDFWYGEQEEIFWHLRELYTVEEDDVKAEQYLAEKLLAYYNTGMAGKRTVDVDFKMSGNAETGYIVMDDSDFAGYCVYTNGQELLQHIKRKYTEWLYVQTEKEREEEEARRESERNLEEERRMRAEGQ